MINISSRIRTIAIAYFIVSGILFLFTFFVPAYYFLLFHFFQLVVLAVAGVFLIKYVYFPLKELRRAEKSFIEGYTIDDIFSQRYHLTSGHRAMLLKIKELLDRHDAMDSNRQQAKYLALQNQINPHFLYNTLEGIRSEALLGEIGEVAKMAELLARFFRYTISNLKRKVSVGDELNNVNYYFEIQKFRFEGRIRMEILFDEDEEWVRNCQMPKLILQPIVENAIIHGIEPMVGQGIVTIRFNVFSQRLVITISDDGIGISEERIDALNEKVKTLQYSDESQSDGGIAMINVNNRIKLLYGEEYGLRFYSKEGVGTDVEISLPLDLPGASP